MNNYADIGETETSTMPRPVFPKSIPEFYAMFPDEEAAFRFIFDARWPDGWACSKCGHDRCYGRTDRHGTECAGCGYVGSITAGTVMHKSSQELRTWLLAAWLLVTDKRGISAKNLQRQLGIGRYETAFQMLHKLRAGMVAPERTKLVGAVEVDETFIGAASTPDRPRTMRDKLIVVGAVEVRTREDVETGKLSSYPGRLRLRHITARTNAKLVEFVRDVVEPGSIVVTDKASVYATLPIEGYEHGVESTADGMRQKDVLRHFHLAVSNLKAWLDGTFHGAVSGQHAQSYLNEFVFRFNRRGNLYAAFERILGIGTHVRGPEYDELYSGEWVHPNPGRKAPR